MQVESGIPQGSVLGPLLFLILIGDIDQEVTSSFVSSFADDTRIGKAISTKEDSEALQKDLHSIYRWAKKNNMEFNCDKFECIRYGKEKNLQDSTTYVSSNKNTIAVKEDVKDLGICMSSDGSFTNHITNITNSSKQMCGWILRTFNTRQVCPMLTLWKSLVRSKLDYCCQLWCPSKKGEIQMLEDIQKSFVKKIEGMKHLNYWEQLQELKLYSLERRRERYMIIYIWKIIEGLVPNIHHDGVASAFNARRGRTCYVPPVSNKAPTNVQNLRYSSLAIKGPKLFNSLPKRLRNIKSCPVENFKKELDIYLKVIPDEPQIQGFTAQRRCESNSIVDMAQHQGSLCTAQEGGDN